MNVEFPRKSRSKRKAIFIKRTQRLMAGLVDAISSRSGSSISAAQRQLVIEKLVHDVHAHTNQQIDYIFSNAVAPQVPHGEFVRQLAEGLGESRKQEA